MKYWIDVQLSREELEELAQVDLSRELAEKLLDRLEHAQAFERNLEHAKQVGERLAWNAEMNAMLDA